MGLDVVQVVREVAIAMNIIPSEMFYTKLSYFMILSSSWNSYFIIYKSYRWPANSSSKYVVWAYPTVVTDISYFNFKSFILVSECDSSIFPKFDSVLSIMRRDSINEGNASQFPAIQKSGKDCVHMFDEIYLFYFMPSILKGIL